VILAPADGVLIGRNVEPGDVVQPGKELMTLAPSGETQILVQVDEKNLAQLRLGQKAIASADAYPREQLQRRSLLHQSRNRLAARLREVKLRVLRIRRRTCGRT
jgi:HlyD family secretion protein